MAHYSTVCEDGNYAPEVSLSFRACFSVIIMYIEYACWRISDITVTVSGNSRRTGPQRNASYT